VKHLINRVLSHKDEDLKRFIESSKLLISSIGDYQTLGECVLSVNVDRLTRQFLAFIDSIFQYY
jgi:hypothetical protein